MNRVVINPPDEPSRNTREFVAGLRVSTPVPDGRKDLIRAESYAAYLAVKSPPKSSVLSIVSPATGRDAGTVTYTLGVACRQTWDQQLGSLSSARRGFQFHRQRLAFL